MGQCDPNISIKSKRLHLSDICHFNRIFRNSVYKHRKQFVQLFLQQCFSQETTPCFCLVLSRSPNFLQKVPTILHYISFLKSILYRAVSRINSNSLLSNCAMQQQPLSLKCMWTSIHSVPLSSSGPCQWVPLGLRLSGFSPSDL